MTDETFPNIYDPRTGPADLLADLTNIFTDAITNHPRSLQTRPGPSEIGHPCDRRLSYKLANAPEVNTGRGLPWKPTFGTSMHGTVQEFVARHIVADDRTGQVGPRFLLEQRVSVGEINGVDITGNTDIYDRKTATVGDYKFVGGTQLRKYREQGPGDQYRVQGHLYGRGLVRLGYPVKYVAIWFLPRDQEFKQHHFWSEPYDEQVALDALARADGIAKLTGALGAAALPMFKTSDQVNCTYCPWFKPGSKDLSGGCPGDPGAAQAAFDASPLHQLIAQ
jgi:hypothetical protein